MINPTTGRSYRPSDVYPGTTHEDLTRFVEYYKSRGYEVEILGFRVPLGHDSFLKISPSRYNGQIFEGYSVDYGLGPTPTTPRIIYTIRTRIATDPD